MIAARPAPPQRVSTTAPMPSPNHSRRERPSTGGAAKGGVTPGPGGGGATGAGAPGAAWGGGAAAGPVALMRERLVAPGYRYGCVLRSLTRTVTAAPGSAVASVSK